MFSRYLTSFMPDEPVFVKKLQLFIFLTGFSPACSRIALKPILLTYLCPLLKIRKTFK